ncbi:MAG: HlyD family type I secretion periplasmic adaptor subunit [Rickettsiales bacterium]|nr:HlyD family type I secretion periplasmic adaptor subunit [Rickettsiales bacterium]
MKIKGTSKIISEEEVKEESLASAASEKKKTQESIVQEEEKHEQENLVSAAEGSDLLYEEVPKGKFHQVKNLAKDMKQEIVEQGKKHKLLAKETIQKARGLSPHVDKFVTVMDKSINYLSTPQSAEGRSEVVQETRAPSVFGIWVLIITFGFFGMWATLAPLDSASHAQGKIILDSKKRIIQHPEGGIIKSILVRDGDEVTKGQTLILLDDAQLRAQKNQYKYKYITSLAEVTRLVAERDGKEEVVFPSELTDDVDDPEVKKAIDNQQKVFDAKKANIASRIALTEKNTAQYLERKNSILPQIEATDKLIQISSDQVTTYKKLFAKGNLSKPDLQRAEGQKAEYEGRKGDLLAKLAETEQQILQSQIALQNDKDKQFEETVSQLKAAQAELSRDYEALKDITERLNRTVITSPEAGVVSNIYEKLSPQGTIQPQQPLMEIVPQDDELIIEAKIRADDISVVRVGQLSRVRLTAYRARVVPVLEGKVISLSADAVVADGLELQTGVPPLYYKARIKIDQENLKKISDLKGVVLYPGMGVDVMIVVGTRTMLKYLMDPITMTLDHAFKEK